MPKQVIWRLDNGVRTYLPRMAGALTAITPVPSDAACYILTQADNTIRMVRPSPSFAPTHPVLLPSNRLNIGLCTPLMKMQRPANPLPCWLYTAEWVTHWRKLANSPMPRFLLGSLPSNIRLLLLQVMSGMAPAIPVSHRCRMLPTGECGGDASAVLGAWAAAAGGGEAAGDRGCTGARLRRAGAGRGRLRAAAVRRRARSPHRSRAGARNY